MDYQVLFDIKNEVGFTPQIMSGLAACLFLFLFSWWLLLIYFKNLALLIRNRRQGQPVTFHGLSGLIARYIQNIPLPPKVLFFICTIWNLQGFIIASISVPVCAIAFVLLTYKYITDITGLRYFEQPNILHVTEGIISHSTEDAGSHSITNTIAVTVGKSIVCVSGVCFPDHYYLADKRFNEGQKIANSLPDGTPVRVTYSQNGLNTILRLEEKR